MRVKGVAYVPVPPELINGPRLPTWAVFILERRVAHVIKGRESVLLRWSSGSTQLFGSLLEAEKFLVECAQAVLRRRMRRVAERELEQKLLKASA